LRVFVIEAVVHPSASRQQVARFVRNGRFHRARVQRLTPTGPWTAVLEVRAGGEAEAVAGATLVLESSGVPVGQLRLRDDVADDG
jgi:hypothetical protein